MWSHSELEECRRRLYPEVDKDVMEKRILEFGGLIRFVLANPDSSFEDVAFTLSAEQAIALYHLSLASVESDLRHIFAHIAVSKPFDLQIPPLIGKPSILVVGVLLNCSMSMRLAPARPLRKDCKKKFSEFLLIVFFQVNQLVPLNFDVCLNSESEADQNRPRRPCPVGIRSLIPLRFW